MERDFEHDWSEDCEKCTRCGKLRGAAHTLTDYICSKCGQVSPEILQLTEKLYGHAEREHAREALIKMGPCVLEALFAMMYKVSEHYFDDKKSDAIEGVIDAIGVNDAAFLLKMLERYNEERYSYTSVILVRIQKLGAPAISPFLEWLTDPLNIRFLDAWIVVDNIHEIAGEKGLEVLKQIAHSSRKDSIREHAIKGLSKIGKPAFPALEALLIKTGESNEIRGAVAESVGDHEHFIPILIELLPHAGKALQEKLMSGLYSAFIWHKRNVVQCFLEKVSIDSDAYFGFMQALLLREYLQWDHWAEILIPYLATEDAKRRGHIISLLKKIGYGNLDDLRRRELDACFELGSNPFRDTTEVLKYVDVIKGDASNGDKRNALKEITLIGGNECIDPVLRLLNETLDSDTFWQAATTLNLLIERTGNKINGRKIDHLFTMVGRSIGWYSERMIIKNLARNLGMTWLEQAMGAESGGAAVTKLQEIGDDASQAILIAVINNNYDGQPTLLAIDALATLGNKKCVLTFLKRLGSKNIDVRLAAAKALARLGDSRWQNIMRGDDDDLNRLGDCGYPEAADALIFALEYSSLEVSSLPFKYAAIRQMERLANKGRRRQDILSSLASVWSDNQFGNWSELARAAAAAQYNIAGIRL